MPELPDVEVFRRYLGSTALHKKIKKSHLLDDRLLENAGHQQVVRRLNGNRFQSTDRHGKYLFVHLKDGWTLVLHFGMTGFLKYYKDKEDASEHAKLIIDFANGYHLSYGNQRRLGRIDLTESIGDFVKEQDLGPDVMSDDFDQERFLELLKGRRGTIKGVLMNQSVMAGVGNIYSDEALFQAGIYPGRSVEKVDAAEQKKLFRTLRRVLSIAIDKQVDPSRFPRGYLLPNRKPGADCPRCGGTIKKTTISGRSAYYCARHQRK